MPDGTDRTWDSKTAFNGTASYYARYRPQYPAEAIEVLREKFHLTQASRVLDLGCGPGHLALPLSEIVGKVYAVDPNAEMLTEARRLAGERGRENIEFIMGESRDLPELAKRTGPVDLTGMGRSFHWMDGQRTLHDLYQMTVPGGGVAMLADSSFTDSRESLATLSPDGAAVPEPAPWRLLIREVGRKWLGEERKAGTSGTFSHSKRHHAEVLRDSEFAGTEVVHLACRRSWNVEQIVGYLYSTSSNSLPVLGENRDAFEADIRERLLAAEPSGVFTEEVSVQIILAWKPAG